MRRTFKFLLRPTARQAAALTEMLADHCALYNAALEERRSAYRQCAKKIRYGDQSAQLKDIRATDPEGQGRWSFSSQQATLRRLNRAFEAFFRRVRAGRKPGYPRFRGTRRFHTVEFPEDGDGCRWNSAPGAVARVRLQGIGHVRVHRHREVAGRIKTISVKREGKRWYVILSCDDVPRQPLPSTGKTIGIDLGVARYLTTSDARHIENPRYGQRAASELATAQQALARCQRGSSRRKKAHQKVAAVQRRIYRQRLDHAHKTALALVREYDVIAHENLSISNMVRAPKPKPCPDQPDVFLPNKATAKARLNRTIYDAGWGVFLGILADKAERAGRRLIPVNARNTSRTCFPCGHVCESNRLTQAQFACVACGHTANADVNAARNIAHRAGLVLREAPAA